MMMGDEFASLSVCLFNLVGKCFISHSTIFPGLYHHCRHGSHGCIIKLEISISMLLWALISDASEENVKVGAI